MCTRETFDTELNAFQLRSLYLQVYTSHRIAHLNLSSFIWRSRHSWTLFLLPTEKEQFDYLRVVKLPGTRPYRGFWCHHPQPLIQKPHFAGPSFSAKLAAVCHATFNHRSVLRFAEHGSQRHASLKSVSDGHFTAKVAEVTTNQTTTQTTQTTRKTKVYLRSPGFVTNSVEEPSYQRNDSFTCLRKQWAPQTIFLYKQLG